MKNLFDSIDEVNQDKIFSDRDKELLIKKLVDTRNYFTHGEKYSELITDINEMYETKLLLQEVLRYYIYQELGMEYDCQDY